MQREGQANEVSVTVVVAESQKHLTDGKPWSWDEVNWRRIEHKRSIADVAVDGMVPDDWKELKKMDNSTALGALRKWIDRMDEGVVVQGEQPRPMEMDGAWQDSEDDTDGEHEAINDDDESEDDDVSRKRRRIGESDSRQREEREAYLKKCNDTVSKFNRHEAVHGERPRWDDGRTSREDMEAYLWLHRVVHENDGDEAKSALGEDLFDIFHTNSYKRTQLDVVLPLWVDTLSSPPPILGS